MGDVDVDGHDERSGGVWTHDVRRPPHPVTTGRHPLLDQPEPGEVGHESADRRPADPESLRELGTGELTIAVHEPEDERQVVATDGVRSCR